MELNPSEHIEAAEMARLLESARQRAGAAEQHPHLAGCPDCREQFEELTLLDRQIENTRPTAPAVRHGDCSGWAWWCEVAGGVTAPEETLASVAHASRCDYCGPLLRQAVAELSALNLELTESEKEYIAGLGSASAEWQKRLAQQIVATQSWRSDSWFASSSWWRPGRVFRSMPGRLAMAGASLVAVAAVSWILVQRNQPAAAGRLLARAYTEKRTLELRIPGADYAPLRVSLGPATSFVGRPAALLKAEALIATQLESHPADPAWLQAQAQADVLEGKYDAAVEALRHALQLQPNSPALLADLGTAYFQRAQGEGRKEDLGAAYECLSQSLQLRPDDPIALFNRALVAEHQFLYQQALDDWDHYLRVEPGSQWSEEARTHADAVREKLKEHGSRAAPLLSPSQIVAVDADAGMGARVDLRIDEYLHEALRSWMPAAFPEAKGRAGAAEGKAAADPSAAQALFLLADLASQHHSDRWLTDLLRGSSAPGFARAANALARAVQSNDGGDYAVSRQQAELAERTFRAAGSVAGRLRAQFEEAFAEQRSRSGQDCRRRAMAAEAESRPYSYPWVQIQLGLEESVCSVVMGDLGGYEEAARHAQDRAQKSGYGALYLRAAGFVADSKFNTGDRAAGWGIVSTGLERYWSGTFPAIRGYNLYSFVAEDANAAGQYGLELAIWREAVSLIDGGEDLLLRASAHSTMARAAAAARQPEVARRQYAESVRLYALAPQTEAIRAARLNNEIMTAELEARQGAFDAALARLTRVQSEVRPPSDNYLAQRFYSTLGEVQLRGHHAAEAEQAFRPALRLAEQNLASLTSEASRMSWSKDAAPVYLGLAEAELVQGREQESLDVFEWYLGAPQRASSPGRALMQTAAEGPSLPDPAHFPARLPLLSDQTVLVYGLLPDGLAIWVYDNRGVRAKWIPAPSNELEDLAASFYAQCSDPRSELSALRRDSHALYSRLITPVELQLDPKRTLVIETEGFLDRLPFEALLDGDGHYLIEGRPVVHSPGPYTQARMHQESAISRDMSTLVVGSEASLPGSGLFVIPNVPAGAEAVAGDFRGARLLKGPEVTLSAVTKALPGVGVFHFAGHAIASANHSGLMLEGRDVDGRTGGPVLLDASEVRKLNLQNMQLAVLAACSTDSGAAGSRGLDSVAEALQSSGVPHVVASRWTVDSVEARSFVDDFYRALLSGQPVSNATRLTSEKMLFDPRTAHPFYWAAFAAYGRA